MKSIFFFIVMFAIIVTACTSSKDGTNADTQKYVSEKIPPGTAIIEAEIQSIEEDSSSQTLNAVVQKVTGYGQSTKPIAAKTVLKIALAKNLITKESDKDYAKVGGVYRMEISQPLKTMNTDSNSEWQAVTIQKLR